MPYLFGSTFAASVPVAIAVNEGNSSALIHGIEGQEMHLSDSGSCLRYHNRTQLTKLRPLCILNLRLTQTVFHKKNVNHSTSLGSPNIPTIDASMASWFSVLEALAAYKTRVSLSMPLGNTYIHKQSMIRMMEAFGANASSQSFC